jgi:trans-aconitate 2-methyltransferase
LKYSDERSRPFLDLLARVQKERALLVVDLGCGPGNLTGLLSERWPGSLVLGVDNSAQMLEQANRLAIPGRMEFLFADIASWSPQQPVDLIFSNAALQWVDDHEALFARFADALAPDGTLAIQMPCHFETPAHAVIQATKTTPRWRATLQEVGLHQKSVLPLAWYVERLHDWGFTVDAWQTTYMHVLTGENPVLEWYKGTALRPLLNRLELGDQEDFLQDVGSRFKEEYPARKGITVMPFPRLFFVATRLES